MSNNKDDMIERNYKGIKYSYNKELKEELAAMDINIEEAIEGTLSEHIMLQSEKTN